MEFRHDLDALELRDGAREYLRGRCTAETLRSLVDGGSANLGCWRELVEMGFTGFSVPGEVGGLGLPDTGFALLAEEAGYVALPEPLIDVAGIAAPILVDLDSDAATAVATGAFRVHTAHTLNPWINQLAHSDKVLRFRSGGIELIDAPTAETLESIDPLRRLSRVTGGEVRMLASGEQADRLAERAARRGAVFSAAELLGLAAAMIDMSKYYAAERKQFGVAIGTFQAVKHHLSTAFTKLEFARPVVYRAATSLAEKGARSSMHVAHAKIAAGDAAINAAEAAIQVHGGIGYTFEADLHLWMKRVWALTGLWGDRNYHMRVVDEAVLDGQLPIGPAATFQ